MLMWNSKFCHYHRKHMKRLVLSVMLLFVFGCSWGQQLRKMIRKEGNTYCLIMDGDAIGVSKDDVVIIPTERGYSSCEYVQRYYIFSKDGLYGLADTSGEEVVPRYYIELSFVSRDSVFTVTENCDTSVLSVEALLEQAKARYEKIESVKYPGRVFHKTLGYYTETVDGFIRMIGTDGEVLVSDVFSNSSNKRVRTKAISYAGKHNGDCFIVYGDDDFTYLAISGDAKYKQMFLWEVDEVKPYDYNGCLWLKLVSDSRGLSVAVLRDETDDTYAYVQISDQYKEIADFILIKGEFYALTVSGEMFATEVGLTLPPVSGQIRFQMPAQLQKLLSYNLGELFTESLARQGYLDAIRIYVRQNSFRYSEYEVCSNLQTTIQLLELSYRYSSECLFMYACLLSGNATHPYIDKERARELFKQYLSILDSVSESDYPWGKSKQELLDIIESRFPELLT